jgi:hypothetical protein
MIRRLALGLCLLIVACSAPPAQVLPPMEPVWRTLVTQPAIVPVFANKNPPRDVIGVTVWSPLFTLETMPAGVVSSASGVLEIDIDNATFGNIGLMAIVLAMSFREPKPFTRFKYSFDLRIPAASGNVPYVNAYYNVQCAGRNFWLGMSIYDPRGPIIDGQAGWDVGTNQAMVHAAPGNANLLDQAVPTASFSSQTFSEWRSYSFAIGHRELVHALGLLKLPTDVSQCRMAHINLNPEIAGKARVKIGVKNWKLETSP